MMQKWFANLGLPLLTKELVEQANRPRTYIIRVIYACLLFFISMLILLQFRNQFGDDPLAILGHGREIFEFLMGLQFAGLYLFLPAITSGAITQEKERDSLMLLFLTKLGPWAIVMEKYLSRLVPMTMLLTLSLPILGFAYSMGGISTGQLLSGIYLLFIAALQVGALAIFCSTYFRTTVGSFVSSYLLLFLMLFGSAIVILTITASLGRGSLNGVGMVLMQMGLVSNEWQAEEFLALLMFAPYHYFESGAAGMSEMMPISLFHPSLTFYIPRLIWQTLPIWLVTLLCLVASRYTLVSRAFLQPRSPLMNLFRAIDRTMSELNERYFQGTHITKGTTSLPYYAPIAWRETEKKAMGTLRYLVRIFVVLEFPVIVICTFSAAFTDGYDESITGISLTMFVLWILGVLMVAVKTTSLVAGERSHQTLDVLLTTPLSSHEIVREKMSAAFRMIYVFWATCLTAVFCKAFFAWDGSRDFDVPLYLFGSLTTLGIYLPMVAWLSLCISLKIRSQSRAIITSIAAIIVWCLGPLLMLFALIVMIELGPGSGPDEEILWLFLSSPAFVVPLIEFGVWDNMGNDAFELGWPPLILNMMGYGIALVVLRSIAYENADQLLGRLSPNAITYRPAPSSKYRQVLQESRPLKRAPQQTVAEAAPGDPEEASAG